MRRPITAIQRERTVSATRKAVLKGLLAYNYSKTGRKDYKQLAFSVRNTKGDIVGGLIAEAFWDWMFVRLLWIDAKHRGTTGRRLMEMAEAEARKRGLVGIWLDTCSFQAPDFYRKLGFRQFGRLKDQPLGHDRFWFQKRF
jgi:N-acetylglutamate synthase-like GNAT family acetyltransferase